MNDVRGRLERLERTARVQRAVGSGVVIVGLLALLSGAGFRQESSAVSDVVTTRALRIVDAGGQVRAVLEPAFDSAHLVIRDLGGRERVFLGADADTTGHGTELELWDRDGDAWVALDARARSASLLMRAIEDQSAGLWVVCAEDSTNLFISSGHGDNEASLGASRDERSGGGHLSLSESRPLEREDLQGLWGQVPFFQASPGRRLDRPPDRIDRTSD